MAARCLFSASAVNRSHLSVHCEKTRCISSTSSSSSTQVQKCFLRTVSANNAGRHGQEKKKLVVRAAAVDDERSDGGAKSEKGRQLWRSELQSNGELSSEFESTLERDIERLTKKEGLEKLWSQQADGGSKSPDQRGVAIRDVADKILVADFFFIIFILGWLLAGLVERTALESTNLIDSWLPLWPSVFQPALGVFMAGAIVSALSKKK